MKTVFKIILSLAMCHLICSCVYTKMSHFSAEELTWSDGIEVGDTAIFLSNKGRKSMLRITHKSISNKLCPFYFSENGSDEYHAFIHYEYTIYQTKDSIEGNVGISKNIEDNTLSISACLDNRCTDNGVDDIDFSEIPLRPKTVKTNRALYHNCIIVDKDNSEVLGKFQCTVNRFIISKGIGLVYYELTTGEAYYRLN